MTIWHAVHTQPRKELIASQHLLRQGFEVYLPQHMKKRRHARRVDWIRSPLFPRYLFVGLNTENRRWRSIHSTVGVSYLVQFGDLPVEVPLEIIDSLQSREDEDGLIKLNNYSRYKPGDSVQILDGAFGNTTGVLETLGDQERVTMLLELMGRQVRIKTTLDKIAAIN